MRTKKTEQYHLITIWDVNNSQVDPFDSIEDALAEASETLDGHHNGDPVSFYLIKGERVPIQINRKPTVTLTDQSAPARKSRTRQTAKGSVTTAGEVPKRAGRPKGSKNKPKGEVAPNPMVVANGKSEREDPFHDEMG